MGTIKRGDSVVYIGAGKASPFYQKPGKVVEVMMGRGIQVAEVRFTEPDRRIVLPLTQLILAQASDRVCAKAGTLPAVDTKINPRHHLAGVMNKTEARYESEYLAPIKSGGKYANYWFEAMTFKIAHDCRYTPDFAVWRPLDSSYSPEEMLELHEVKGTRDGKLHWEDDAKVKMQAFVAKFPFRLIVAYFDNGAWQHQEIKR